MHRLRSYAQFLLSVVVVGILVNALSTYLDSRYPAALRYTIQLAVLVAAVWAFVLIGRFALEYLTSGRYAVLAMILNDRDELLLYRHPLHKVMLPPGGRVRGSEFPHEALQKRLEERIGLRYNEYVFDMRFTPTGGYLNGNTGDVQKLPPPAIVQREMHRQRNYVKFHYAFVYVLQINSEWLPPENSKYGPMYFVGQPNLRDMVNQGRVYPDVLDSYERLLQVLAKDPP